MSDIYLHKTGVQCARSQCQQIPSIVLKEVLFALVKIENKKKMEANSPFEALFTTFTEALRDAGSSFEVASHYGPTKCVESMFEYFWGLKEAHHSLDINILESLKSQRQADLSRIEGNIYYNRGQFSQAVESYNMCIRYAPSPSGNNYIKEISMQGSANDTYDEQKNTSLAYGFANRSAVLFELGEYEKSINDIYLAIKNGYPIGQIPKLVERKVKRLLELRKQQDAKSLICSTIRLLSRRKIKLVSSLENLQKDQTDSEDYEENTPNEVDPFRNLINMKPNNVDSSDIQVSPHLDYNIPKLDSKHSTILSVSSALRMAYTTEQGRFFVADRDIKPGELLLVEKSPYSCLHLNKDLICSHCCVCLMTCDSPLPCRNCTMAMFCSEACQSKSFNGHTDIECSTLQTLDSLCVGNFGSLAFKVVTQIPYVKLKTLVPASKKYLAESVLNHHGFNENGIFDSSDFLSIYAMVNNQSERDVDDLFKIVALAFVLTKLLIQSNCYFIDEAGFPFCPNDADIILLGSTFVTLIMSFHCNTHSIGGFQPIVKGVEIHKVIGVGLFPAASRLNHSCNPGTVRYTIGKYMTSYAIRFISKGSAVTDSYGCHYAIHDTEYRQAELKKNYLFECNCEACIEKWTFPGKESSKPKFNSLNNKNMNLQIEKEDELIEKFEKLKLSFKKTYLNIIKEGVTEESKMVIIDFIEFLDRHVIFPCKIYHDVQGLLEFCIEKESSVK